MEPEKSAQDMIPDSLLAFAKDERYIRQCQDLLKNVFRQEESTSLSWWGSVLLYATLVVGRKGKTLGMEFVGLKHQECSPWQRRLGLLALTAGWITWTRQYQITLREQTSLRQVEARHEALRGNARLRFHEQQRLAMLNRASRTSASTTATESLNPRTNNDREQTSTLVDRLERVFCNVLSSLSEATASSSSLENPHALPGATAMSLGRWILRLHLAHYLLTGRYPTLWHRLLNLPLQERKEASRLSDPPPTTHRLVGKLILIQAGASLTQFLAQRFASYVATKPKNAATTPATLEKPDDVPSAASPSSPCGICRQPHSHPAIPSSCGHVFCWKCLYQWVATVRPECPLCRSSCRPQDIVALHNYTSSHEQDS